MGKYKLRHVVKHWLLVAIALLFNSTITVRAQTRLDIECGMVFSGYNQVRIPGNGGTQFDLHKDFKDTQSFFYRFRLGKTFANKHNVSLLYAPLTLRYEGMPAQSINFVTGTFQVGDQVFARYKFNSYRLSYRYLFIQRDNLVLGAGLTGKIRDASIRLHNSTTTAEKTDVGFVPLINFYLKWLWHYKWGMLVEGDALAAKQGRAEDVFVGIVYEPYNSLGFKAGYRILEGGADNNSVYNFSLIHYASAGLLLKF